MRFFLLTLFASTLTLTTASIVEAGTGTCTAGDGAIINGGKCCQALGGSGCTCDESKASTTGIVTCTDIKIKEGDSVVVNSSTQPKQPLDLKNPTRRNNQQHREDPKLRTR
jgi:hypothetical protein